MRYFILALLMMNASGCATTQVVMSALDLTGGVETLLGYDPGPLEATGRASNALAPNACHGHR